MENPDKGEQKKPNEAGLREFDRNAFPSERRATGWKREHVWSGLLFKEGKNRGRVGRPSCKEETILAIYLYVADFLVSVTVLP